MRTVVDAIADTVGRADIADMAGGAGTLTVAPLGSGPDTCLSWSDVHEQARRMASVLAGHGVGPGGRVGLLGDTSAGLITAIQAVWLRGAAFTILPPPGRAGQRAHLANLSAIVVDAGFDLVIIDEKACDGWAPPAKVELLSTLELEAKQAAPCAIIRPSSGDLAVLQYTSGSTSSPRGVPVTHGNLAANLDAIEAAIGRDALDPATTCWLSWLPLYHDMGLIGFLALPMSRGCPLVLQSPMAFALRPASWLARLSRHRATTTGGPNFAYALMAQLLEGLGERAGGEAPRHSRAGNDCLDADIDLSSVRHMFSGGEPIDAAMMARFTAAGARRGLDPNVVVAAYGLAESTLAVSFSRIGSGITVDAVDQHALESDGQALPAVEGMASRQLVRVGRAVPGTRIRIVNETGSDLAARTVGHIEVSGPSVVGDGWLRTGDLGYIADGELVVCGRAKDVLFAAGRNVYPQDVEAAATQVPGVRPGGAAAFGIPAELGDRLVVAVEARGDGPALRKAVAIAVTSETGMAPADVVMLRFGRLPKTSSGKLRRAETRRRYLAGELTEANLALVDRSIQ